MLTLKFRSGRYLAPLMGALMSESLRRRPVEVDLVVPVPLSRRRLRARGYNQAALLAVCLNTAPLAEVLVRRDRPPQQTLSAHARLVNLDGIISCRNADAVMGKRVLLVDDVITTGATVSACAATLHEAGAARVYALAFARDL